MKDGAKEALTKIATMISSMSNPIVVDGHTDNLPLSSTKFPSNWEVAVARAMSVVQYMLREGDINPGILAATDYGEYRPIESNETLEGRRQNRRVEFFVQWYL